MRHPSDQHLPARSSVPATGVRRRREIPGAIRTGAIIYCSYKYFYGDNGAGIGASHQTGWTGVVATLIEIFGQLDAQSFPDHGRDAAFDLG